GCATLGVQRRPPRTARERHGQPSGCCGYATPRFEKAPGRAGTAARSARVTAQADTRASALGKTMLVPTDSATMVPPCTPGDNPSRADASAATPPPVLRPGVGRTPWPRLHGPLRAVVSLPVDAP